MNKQIGFIGGGNMGKAMIAGIVRSGLLRPERIYVCDHHKENLEQLHMMYGVYTTCDLDEVAKSSDILILSIKPKNYEEVIVQIKNLVKKNVIIVDIAAGISLQNVKDYFGKEIKVAKAMPNTPAQVMEAMSAISFDDMITAEEKGWIQSIFSSFGRCEIVDETMMDVVTSVSGSSPAYVFMMIEAMADAAVKQGMKRNQAYIFAAQAVFGSAKMVLETGLHPGILKDAVCSPQGTTIEAVSKLEETGFRHCLIEAMDACCKKSKSMSK